MDTKTETVKASTTQRLPKKGRTVRFHRITRSPEIEVVLDQRLITALTELLLVPWFNDACNGAAATRGNVPKFLKCAALNYVTRTAVSYTLYNGQVRNITGQGFTLRGEKDGLHLKLQHVDVQSEFAQSVLALARECDSHRTTDRSRCLTVVASQFYEIAHEIAAASCTLSYYDALGADIFAKHMERFLGEKRRTKATVQQGETK